MISLLVELSTFRSGLIYKWRRGGGRSTFEVVHATELPAALEGEEKAGLAPAYIASVIK